jgi:hypothetical protein
LSFDWLNQVALFLTRRTRSQWRAFSILQCLSAANLITSFARDKFYTHNVSLLVYIELRLTCILYVYVFAKRSFFSDAKIDKLALCHFLYPILREQSICICINITKELLFHLAFEFYLHFLNE